MALRHVPVGSVVCDIGTYDGRFFSLAADKHVTGVGLDPELQGSLPKVDGVEFRRGTASEVLTMLDHFDVVTALAVLEHIPVDAMVRELTNVREHLKPDGRLVITLPSPRVDAILKVLAVLRLIEGQMLHQHYGLSLEVAEKVICSSGFDIVERRSFQLGLNTVVVFQRRNEFVGTSAPVT